MSDKVKSFGEDLNVALSEVRAVLNHWNLRRDADSGQWNEYLVVRVPGKPDSFVVLEHPEDKSGFAEKLVAFHKSEAAEGR